MEITFNNHTQQIQQQTSVQLIINDLLGEKQKGIAVAVNETGSPIYLAIAILSPPIPLSTTSVVPLFLPDR